MKSNFFKYIFIIFVIGIMAFAIYKIQKDETNQKQQQEITNARQEEEKQTQIKLGIASMDTINPILTNNKNVQEITKLIYEPLINLTQDYKTEPCLAIEWAKQNQTSYIIKLRENVKWSNGQEFTADDVRFTIDRLKDSPTIYAYQVQYVIGVDVVDKYTIRINLDREVPFFEYNLTFPILSSKYYEGEDFKTTSKNASPVGTGKYKITEVQPSYLTLEKNTNWWNKEQNLSLDKITINLYSSVGELYNSFKIGNIDIIGTSNTNLQEYIGTIGYNKSEMKGREHDFLIMNTQNYFLSKPEVRKAIAYSIDRENIVSSIYGSNYYTSSFPLDYGTWIYQEQDVSLGYNPDQGKQLLIDNGWTYKYKYWQKYENYKTQRIVLNLSVKSSDENRVKVAENIAAQLRNQGFRINVVKLSDSAYSSAIEKKSYDIMLCSTYLSPSPDLTTYFGENNLANYSNEEVTTIMNEIKNSTDENILKEKYKRLGEIYKTEIPYLSLYTNKYIVAYNTGLVGEITPNWFSMFYNINTWYK